MSKARTNKQIATDAIRRKRIPERDINLLKNRRNRITNALRRERNEVRNLTPEERKEWQRTWDKTVRGRTLNAQDKDLEKATDRLSWHDIYVEDEQALKGFRWLWNLYKSPTGRERKNNPFGYREQRVLERANNGDRTTHRSKAGRRLVHCRFTFDGFYDAGNYFVTFYVPIYTLTNDAGSFQYYVSGGRVHIIG